MTPDDIAKVVSSNVFGAQDVMGQIQGSLDPEMYKEAEKHFVSSLYPTVSFLNHTCMSNSNFFFIGNFIFVIACQDIQEGDEILVSYYLQTLRFEER